MKRYDKYLFVAFILFAFSLSGAIFFTNIYARIFEAVACIGSLIMIIFLSHLHYFNDKKLKEMKVKNG